MIFYQIELKKVRSFVPQTTKHVGELFKGEVTLISFPKFLSFAFLAFYRQKTAKTGAFFAHKIPNKKNFRSMQLDPGRP